MKKHYNETKKTELVVITEVFLELTKTANLFMINLTLKSFQAIKIKCYRSMKEAEVKKGMRERDAVKS